MEERNEQEYTGGEKPVLKATPMITIKFRGKRVDNGEWIIGNLFVPDVLVKGIYICPRSSYANFYPDFEDGDDINDHKSSGCSLGHFHEVIPETVGQFTGLLDKNGVEVYEGDHVVISSEHIHEKADGFDGIVKYIECCFYVDRGTEGHPLWSDSYDIEIIGNTHQQ